MSNSILDLVNSQRGSGNQPQPQMQQIQQVKNLMHQLGNTPNPSALLMQNPGMQNIMNILRMTNMTPQQYAEMLAQQKGVDLNMLIQELQK